MVEKNDDFKIDSDQLGILPSTMDKSATVLDTKLQWGDGVKLAGSTRLLNSH